MCYIIAHDEDSKKDCPLGQLGDYELYLPSVSDQFFEAHLFHFDLYVRVCMCVRR